MTDPTEGFNWEKLESERADIESKPAATVPPRKTPSSGPSQRKRSGRRPVPTTGSHIPRSHVNPLPGRKDAYKEGLNGLLQLGAGITLPFAPADAAAILEHGDNVSEAVADLAISDERIAALLDKVLVAGPYGAVLAAVVPMVAQFAVNHGMLPAGILGTRTPEHLVMGLLGEEAVKQAKDDESTDGGEYVGNENHAAPDHVHA